MIYELAFLQSPLKEWKKLDVTTRGHFKNKLKERLNNPSVLASKLSGYTNRYKIKLRASSYRLVYKI